MRKVSSERRRALEGKIRAIIKALRRLGTIWGLLMQSFTSGQSYLERRKPYISTAGENQKNWENRIWETTNQKVVGSNPAGLTIREVLKNKTSRFCMPKKKPPKKAALGTIWGLLSFFSGFCDCLGEGCGVLLFCLVESVRVDLESQNRGAVPKLGGH